MPWSLRGMHADQLRQRAEILRENIFDGHEISHPESRPLMLSAGPCPGVCRQVDADDIGNEAGMSKSGALADRFSGRRPQPRHGVWICGRTFCICIAC